MIFVTGLGWCNLIRSGTCLVQRLAASQPRFAAGEHGECVATLTHGRQCLTRNIWRSKTARYYSQNYRLCSMPETKGCIMNDSSNGQMTYTIKGQMSYARGTGSVFKVQEARSTLHCQSQLTNASRGRCYVRIMISPRHKSMTDDIQMERSSYTED